MKKILITLITVVICITAVAQKWTTYTCKEYINCIAPDGNKVWTGTQGGVLCRDTNGTFISQYTIKDGLSGNNVTCIAIDAQGNKWFGTDNGVSKFDGATWTTYDTTNSGLAGNSVTCMTIDAQGNKWFGMWADMIGSYGVSKFDGTTWTTYDTSNSGLACFMVTCLSIDAQGNIWVGTDNGIRKFDGTTWTTYNTSNSGLANNSVTCISFDNQGNKWFGTGAGVSKFDGSTWTNHSVGTDSFGRNMGVYSLLLDDQGNIWVRTAPWTTQIVRYDATTWTVNYMYGLQKGNFICMIKGANNNIWFGTTTKGLIKYDGITKTSASWKTDYYKNSGIAGNIVYCSIIDAQNNKWFGTNNGLSKFDGTTWTTYRDKYNDEIFYSIAIDAQGIIWLTGKTAVYYFDGIKFNYYYWGEYFTTISIDAQNNKWIGTSDGVLKSDDINLTRYNTKNSGLAGNSISCISIDAQGNKWFVTENGVSKFDDITWTTYNTSNSGLLSNYISCISIDDQGNKWFGAGNGVSKFDNVTWTTYNTGNSGLPFDYVSSISIDADGNKWFGTEGGSEVGGISKFDGITWTNYDTSNSGIPYNYTSFISIDADGNKWFGPDGVVKLEDGGAGPLNLNKDKKCIFGSVFNDINGNGVKDTNELLLPYKYVLMKNDSTVATTQDNGIYYFIRPNGTYQIKFIPCQFWQLTTDSIKTVVITDTTTKITGVDFGIKFQSVSDVTVDLTGGIARAGFNVQYWLTYKNAGSETKSGEVILHLDTLISFIRSWPAPDKIIENTLTWNYSNLASLKQQRISLTLKMPDVSHRGDTLKCTAFITPLEKDTMPANNTSMLKQVIIGSYDPNDKSESKGIGNEGYTLLGQELIYTIRFQNTGTDTAFSVVVRDTIDNNMNIETFRIVSSSHTVKTDIRNKNAVSFIFDNINLPDSIQDEPASHGFVKYAVSPYAGLTENAEVKNKANIYFDYNPPVMTNEVTNTYVKSIPVIPVSVKEINTGPIHIYPNPASDKINIDVQDYKVSKNFTVSIFSVQGQLLIQQPLQTKQNAINVNQLAKGIYILKIESTEGIVSRRFVKE